MSQFIEELAVHSSRKQVHIILDGRSIQQLEQLNGEARQAFRALAKTAHIVKFVAITRNMKVQLQFNALSRDFGLNWRNVSSMNDATKFLKSQDTSINIIPTEPESNMRLDRVS
jgi:hypothetical protein